MILFLHGADTFRSRKQLHEMIAKFRQDRDPQGMNMAHLVADEVEQGQMQEQLYASPFLADKRLLVVEKLLQSKHGDFISQLLDVIKEKKLPDTTTLLLWEEEKVGRSKAVKELFELLKKEKFTYEFPALTGRALEQWIESEIQKKGGTCDRGVGAAIARGTGESMWQINGIVEQLVAYCDGRAIGVDDVTLFVSERADDNIFALAEAIVQRQGEKAYAMIQQQYAIGEDAHFCLAMTARQIRILLEMRDYIDRTSVTDSKQLASALGIHPFVAKKSLPLAQRYSLPQLERLYRALLDIDIKTKTGQGTQSLLLDLFVGKLAKV